MSEIPSRPTPRPPRKVEFRIRPRLVLIGMAITLLGLAALYGRDLWVLQPMRTKLAAYRTVLVWLWWATSILSVVVIASLACTIGGRLLARIGRQAWQRVRARHRRRIAVACGCPGGSLAPPDATTPLARWPAARRRILGFWFTSILVWVVVELTGAALLLWMHRVELAPLPANLPPGPNDELHLVAIGGSTTQGQPYQARLSLPDLVGWRLQAMVPGTKISVKNLAASAASLDHMYAYLQSLQRRPDVLIIYSGHNEFLARFRCDAEIRSTFPAIRPPSLMASAIGEHLDRLNLAVVPTEPRRFLFDLPAVTASQMRAVYRTFEHTLQQILQFCDRHGTLPVLIIPASNESGFAPNRSVLDATASWWHEQRIRSIYSQLASGRLGTEQEIRLLQEACELAPRFAESWYRLGRVYEQLGEFHQARRCYRQAIDTDAFPLRATSEIVQIYRRLAGKYDAVLLDARDVLRPLTPAGLLGDHLFHDHCHPTLRGYVVLGDTIARKLIDTGRITGGNRAAGAPQHASVIPAGALGGVLRAAPPPIHEPPVQYDSLLHQAIDDFAIDPAAWIKACEVEAWVNNHLCAFRFDPQRRAEKSRRFKEAAARLQSGERPENIKVLELGPMSP